MLNSLTELNVGDRCVIPYVDLPHTHGIYGVLISKTAYHGVILDDEGKEHSHTSMMKIGRAPEYILRCLIKKANQRNKSTRKS